VPLIAGRRFKPNDLTDIGVPALVSERFWRTTLAGGDWTRAGLVVNRQSMHVVGVVADGFEGPGGLFAPDLWLPLEARRTLGVSAALGAPDASWLTVLARPRPGIGALAVTEEARRIVRTTSALRVSDLRVEYVPMSDGHPEVRRHPPRPRSGNCLTPARSLADLVAAWKLHHDVSWRFG
jgi:hypothetical protein